jgi:phenylpropionate dioxygenase-like ring-hydroxylating dioxygenase large terminal subunit
MDLQEEQALVERAWRHIDAGTSESREPSISPVERYIDPQRHQLELERVFREWPIAICPAATLVEPGASFAIDVAGLPLLLVRAENGTVHGHVNACRHRGARLQAPGPGQQRVFVCPYHSWTYGLDGALRGRPHPQDFPQAPPADCSLAAVPVGEALGMLWVIPRVLRPGESACLDMTAYLGRFGRDLRSWGYDSFVPFDQRDFINRANWKMPFEANLELYHVHYAHRNTIKELFHDNLMIADVDRQRRRDRITSASSFPSAASPACASSRATSGRSAATSTSSTSSFRRPSSCTKATMSTCSRCCPTAWASRACWPTR